MPEQKARTTYDNILRLVENEPDVREPIKFLRAREIVHFQRFGEAKREDTSKYPGSGKFGALPQQAEKQAFGGSAGCLF